MGNFRRSTLLRKVNANPKDPSIRAEFMKWTRANNVVLKGLVRRREAEAKLYEQL
jgi:lysozyme